MISRDNQRIHNEIDTLQGICKWNQSTEQIMTFLKHDFLTFAITVQEMPIIKIYDTQNTDDFRQEIVFRGYILEQSIHEKVPVSIGSMRCFVHYRFDYDNLIRDYLFMQDFSLTAAYRNKGYGSLMIQYVQNYARENRLYYIKGWLSDTDTSPHMGNQREILHHFYKKHGFIIDGNSIYCSLQ